VWASYICPMTKTWTESEMDELRALFPNTPNKELATKFNCTLYVIRNIACKNGLKKSEAYMEDYLKNKAHQHLPKYNKGQTSWCKGTKGVMTNGVETRFKKGQIPHNIKPIGHLSICKGYITIKTEEGYKKLHRVIWEQHNGKIPPLKLVIFKDGNNRNFDIDNLQLVDKVHHMLKHHPMKYPQDIKDAINIKREIIKYINKHGKKQD
jgi:HNH endonuclease